MPVATRKLLRCQNCDYPLEPDFNYCPRCSQENSEKLTSFGTLVFEVVSNFLSYDSRFVQTIYPFLVKPGFLTNEYISGRRVRYTHPLRLYVFVSVIYFSVVSLVISSNPGLKGRVVQTDANEARADSIKAQVARDLRRELPPEQVARLDSAADTTLAQLGQMRVSVDLDSTDDDKESEIQRYLRLVNRDSTTEDQVLDSLRWEKNTMNRLKVRQGIRIAHIDKREFLEYFLGKISLMMFVMIPFLALLLKLFYVRRKRFYMEHLTFLLHIHAFIFFALAIAFLLDHYQASSQSVGWALLLVLVYVTVSFRNVYRQGWFKTVLKMFLFFITYLFSLVFFIIGTLAVTAILV